MSFYWFDRDFSTAFDLSGLRVEGLSLCKPEILNPKP